MLSTLTITNRVTRFVLGTMTPGLFRTADLASNPVSKSFINDIIIKKTTFLQDVYIVCYVFLMFTNRLSGIKVAENRT